jgi:Ca2+-transporting ATPase
VVFVGAIMAIGTLGVLAWQREVGTEEHALAMAFTTFVFFQIFNVFNARNETGTAFSRDSLRNSKLWLALGVVAFLQVLAVHFDPVQNIFGTADLKPEDWLVVIGVSSTVLLADEARRAVIGARARR